MNSRGMAVFVMVGLAMVGAGAVAFYGVRNLVGESTVEADPAPSSAPVGTPSPLGAPAAGETEYPDFPEHPGDDVTPEPGATPDPSQPWWYVPWLNANRGKPYFDGTLAGIRIGSGISGPVFDCQGQRSTAEESEADGSAVDVSPAHLPGGARLVDGLAGLCDGQPFLAEARYNVPSDASSGRLGGEVLIFRQIGEPIAAVSEAFDRWGEIELEGRTVAAALPILPELGIGGSAIVFYEGGVVTVVRGNWMEWDEMLAIAGAMLSDSP